MRILFPLFIFLIFGFVSACAKPASEDAVKKEIDKIVNRIIAEDEKASEFKRVVNRIDVNGDNVDDVVGFFTIEGYGGGNSATSHMTVLISEAFGTTELGTVQIGSIPTEPMRFSTGQIEFDELINGPDDAACCPTQKRVARYRVDGGVREVLDPSLSLAESTTPPEGSSDTPILPRKEPASTSCSSSPFVMKGLCIGMPMSEAVTKIEGLLQIKLKSFDFEAGVEDAPLDGPEVQVVSEEIDLLVGNWTVHMVGRNGYLHSLIIKTSAVSKLFNAADLTPEEFAQAFADGYSISKMEGKYQQIYMHNRWVTIRTWSHRFDGVYIQVMGADELPAKSVLMSSVPKEASRTFD